MFYRQNHIYMLEFKLGQKKNLKKSRKGVEKAAHFLLSQEKGTMALIHLEVKLENSRTMALTVELCFPLRLVCRWQFRAETAPWNMIPNSGQGCKATKDHLPPPAPTTHTLLNIQLHSLFLIHGKESSGYTDYLGICRVFCQKRYKLISNVPSWTNQEVSSPFALF